MIFLEFILILAYIYKIYANWKLRKKEFEESKEELDNQIEDLLGPEALDLIKKGKPYVGMPACLIRYSNGEPEKVEKSSFNEDYYQHWYFGISKRYKYAGEEKIKYRTKIVVVNDEVSGIIKK
jgi:hypothetical protein